MTTIMIIGEFMRKINNILIPIDFSSRSINALKYGIEMAKISKSQVHVLHAFRLIDRQNSIGNDQAIELRNKLKKSLHKELMTLKETHADTLGVESIFDLQIGFPEDVIESLLMNHAIDLIIMSMTGAGNNPAPFGSTFSSVVNMNSTSILAIPENTNYTIGGKGFLNQMTQKSQSSLNSINSGLISIANEDFEKLKKSFEEKEETEKNNLAFDPILIYC